MTKHVYALLSLWKLENILQKTCHNLYEILKCIIIALAVSLSLPALELCPVMVRSTKGLTGLRVLSAGEWLQAVLQKEGAWLCADCRTVLSGETWLLEAFSKIKSLVICYSLVYHREKCQPRDVGTEHQPHPTICPISSFVKKYWGAPMDTCKS